MNLQLLDKIYEMRDIALKKHLVSYIFFLTAILDVAVSFVNFGSGKISLGAIYLFLAVIFVALGLRYRKKENKIV